MNKRERICNWSGDYGFRGEKTGHYIKNTTKEKDYEVSVGDLIAFNIYHKGTGELSSCGIVVKDRHGNFGVMGWMNRRLDLDNASLVLRSEAVPIEMVRALHGNTFEYKKDEAVEMTLDEIEELVGKRVKVIKGGY